jgi:cell division protein FtsB
VNDVSSEHSYRPRTTVWSRLNICLGVFIAFVVALTLGYQVLPFVKEKATQDTKIAELGKNLDAARMYNKRLALEVRLLQTDPDFLAVYARDRLTPGYMREGETIFRIENHSPR